MYAETGRAGISTESTAPSALAFKQTTEVMLTICRQLWIALRFDPPDPVIDRLPPTEQDVWFACALADIAAHSEQRRRLDRLWDSPISLGDSIRFRLLVLVDAQPDCTVSATRPALYK